MIPFSVHIVMLGVFMTLNGVAIGCIDNGEKLFYTTHLLKLEVVLTGTAQFAYKVHNYTRL